MLSKLQGSSLQPESQQLLQGVPVLQEWQRAAKPSHTVRDAMTKLGSHWDVAQRANGKERSPTEVAQDIEKSMLKKANVIVVSSVAKPAISVTSAPKPASAQSQS